MKERERQRERRTQTQGQQGGMRTERRVNRDREKKIN